MAKNNRFHILVIRLSALGDVAMTVPVLSALTQQHPELKITVLTRSFFAPMFESLRNVAVYKADVKGKHKGVLGLWRLYRELRKLEVDVIADLHNVLRSNILKRYFRMEKIPFVQVDKGREEKKALTASKDKTFKQLQSTHERYADVFRSLGYPLVLDKSAWLAKKETSKETLELIGLDHKKWIGIAPFAAFEGKMYPLEKMKEVLEKLNHTEKYKIILFGGGPNEKSTLEGLAEPFTNVLSVAGRLGFKEELTLISNLDLMLSMDSGNGHLAAIYGINVITIWGVTHPFAGFAPFAQAPENALLADRTSFPEIPTSVYGNKMPKGYQEAIATITPEQILHKIEECLD